MSGTVVTGVHQFLTMRQSRWYQAETPASGRVGRATIFANPGREKIKKSVDRGHCMGYKCFNDL